MRKLKCTLNVHLTVVLSHSLFLLQQRFILIIKICALDKKDQTFVDAYNMLATVLGWDT